MSYVYHTSNSILVIMYPLVKCNTGSCFREVFKTDCDFIFIQNNVALNRDHNCKNYSKMISTVKLYKFKYSITHDGVYTNSNDLLIVSVCT